MENGEEFNEVNKGGKWFSSSKEMRSKEFGLIELFRDSIKK